MSGEILAAGGGFLLAVLWFDLMFDVQALRAPRDVPLPEPVLASIAGYYRRVTIDAQPMPRLVALVMAVLLATALLAPAPAGAARVASLALLGVPIALALGRVFPQARRLAARADPPAEQSRLARSIAWAHVACLAAIAAFLALQLAR
jgi:hypothetical protein